VTGVSFIDNAPWAGAAPRLSVLIPFYRESPNRLLAALDGSDADVEIVVLDDGSGDAKLSDAVAGAVRSMTTPARFLVLEANEGRAAGRNRLAAEARGRHLLFLDSDMLPDAPGFLLRWQRLVGLENPAVAFGGFSLDQAPRTRANAVHRAMALRSDCLPAATRRLAPEKHVFNLQPADPPRHPCGRAVRRRLRGWGWEDVEWAMRVSRRHPIVHIDNPATHLGLTPARTMADKFEQSAANFARVVRAHHDIVSQYPSYRAARMLKRVPLRGLWRPWLKATALFEAAPDGMRAFALRLYRAALYAEAV